MKYKLSEILEFITAFIWKRASKDKKVNENKESVRVFAILLFLPEYLEPSRLEGHNTQELFDTYKEYYKTKKDMRFNRCIIDCFESVSKKFKGGLFENNDGKIIKVDDAIKNVYRILLSF